MLNRYLIGKVLLTLTLLATPAFHLIADWTIGHIHDEAWPAHAKYHLIVYHLTLVLFALPAVYACWAATVISPPALFLVVYTAFAFWIPIFFATVFPQASPYATKQLGEQGTPIQFYVGAGVMLTAIVGWLAARRPAEIP